MGRKGPAPIAPEEIALRKAYMRPLRVHLLLEEITAQQMLVDQALELAVAAGEPVVTSRRVQLPLVVRGRATIPPWLVENVCRVLGKSVAEVMGAEWVEQFGEDGRGGSQRAPVGGPRIQRLTGTGTGTRKDSAESRGLTASTTPAA
jgi:hypothetical protein